MPERGHPVRLSAQREPGCDSEELRLSVLRALADRMSALHPTAHQAQPRAQLWRATWIDEHE